MSRRCYNCNQKLDESTFVCPNCGKNVYDKEGKLNKSKIVYKTDNKEKVIDDNNCVQTNKFALIGFVLSLISTFIYGGFLWLGIIFSIIGLIDCKRKNQKGKAFANAGIVISVIYIVMGIIFACLMSYFVFNNR